MGFKNEKDLQKSYEEYGESLASEEGDYKKYLTILEKFFGKEYIKQLDMDKLNALMQVLAKREFSEKLITRKTAIAEQYNKVVIDSINVPKVSKLREDEKELEKEVSIKNVINSFIDFANILHDKNNPVSVKIAKGILAVNGVAKNTSKMFSRKDGKAFALDEAEDLKLVFFDEKEIAKLIYGNVGITVSEGLIDLQFGDREGAIISTDSEDFKYYILPEKREDLLKKNQYEIKPEWYVKDLTQEISQSSDNVCEIISSALINIEDKELKEKCLQDINVLLASARLNTITHIPDERDEKMSQAMERIKEYHDRVEGEKRELIEENKELKKKIENSVNQDEALIQENDYLKATLQIERETIKGVLKKFPIIGRIMAKKIKNGVKEARAKDNSLMPGLGNNIGDIFEGLKVKNVNYSKVETESQIPNKDNDRGKRIK